MVQLRSSKRRDRGVVIIWVALFMLLMLCFIAVGVDLAKLMATRTQLQNAADAAALAGASAVNPLTGGLVQATASARATETGAQNTAFVGNAETVAIAGGDITFPASNKVKVITRREGANSITVYFAHALGIHSLDMTATATAKADTASSLATCPIPMATQWPVSGTFIAGQVYTLKLGPGTGTRGNYGWLDPSNCSNASECGSGKPHQIACLIGKGCCGDMKVGEAVQTSTGIKGPAGEGLTDRWNADTDQRSGITYAQYTGNGQRVLIVPIITGTLQGQSSVTVSGFGAFFLQTKPDKKNDDITGEYIYISSGGEGGGGGSGGAVVFTPVLCE